MAKCTIRVRFKPYVAQFIRSVEIIDANQPVSLSDGGLLVSLVKTFLSGKTFYIQKHRPAKEERKAKTDYIDFIPDSAQWDRGRLFLTNKHEWELSDLCRRFMIVVLMSHIDQQIRNNNGRVIHSIRQFMRDYDLEECVEEDTLMRAVTRLRKSKGLEPYTNDQARNAKMSRKQRIAA